MDVSVSVKRTWPRVESIGKELESWSSSGLEEMLSLGEGSMEQSSSSKEAGVRRESGADGDDEKMHKEEVQQRRAEHQRLLPGGSHCGCCG